MRFNVILMGLSFRVEINAIERSEIALISAFFAVLDNDACFIFL